MNLKNFSFFVDNVLDEDYYQDIKSASQKCVFKTLEDDERKFHVAYPPKDLSFKIQNCIETVFKRKIHVLNSFLRISTEFLNTNWGIHADLSVLNEETPSHGAVFYLSQNLDFMNGTALWRHKDLGLYLPEGQGEKELTANSYNEIDQWDLNSIIGGVENRLVSYPSHYFHSKFPQKAWGATQENCRLVLVMFYKI